MKSIVVNMQFSGLNKKIPRCRSFGGSGSRQIFKPVSVPLALSLVQGKKTHSAAVPFFPLPVPAFYPE
jgi:hypothetical protein